MYKRILIRVKTLNVFKFVLCVATCMTAIVLITYLFGSVARMVTKDLTGYIALAIMFLVIIYWAVVGTQYFVRRI